MLHCC